LDVGDRFHVRMARRARLQPTRRRHRASIARR
jgi:hypothetical protein